MSNHKKYFCVLQVQLTCIVVYSAKQPTRGQFFKAKRLVLMAGNPHTDYNNMKLVEQLEKVEESAALIEVGKMLVSQCGSELAIF